jgi:hypothetical protein
VYRSAYANGLTNYHQRTENGRTDFFRRLNHPLICFAEGNPLLVSYEEVRGQDAGGSDRGRAESVSGFAWSTKRSIIRNEIVCYNTNLHKIKGFHEKF